MIHTPDTDRRQALGDFLRAHRERLAPEAIGLGAGARRRTPGLRREEVAQIGGLSTTWYTWIEQGREVSASPEVLARIADVLQLGRAERAYVFQLAGKRDPDPGATEPEHIPAALAACLDAIACPAYLLDHRWTARGWNAPAQRLFVGWLHGPGEPNLLRYIFLDPQARAFICDWEVRARRVAAEFRAASSAHLDDPAVGRLVAELRHDSADFARFWLQHGVLEREGGERTFRHPQRGFLRYEQVSFEVAVQPDLRLTMLVPADPGPGSSAARVVAKGS